MVFKYIVYFLSCFCLFSTDCISLNDKYQIIDFGTLNTSASSAISINNKGDVLGYYQEDGKFNYFVWSESSGLKPLVFPDYTKVYLEKINDFGQIIGLLHYNGGGSKAFIMDSEGNLTFFEKVFDKKIPEVCHPLNLNNNGQVVGFISFRTNASSNEQKIPFFWNREKVIPLSLKSHLESPLRNNVNGEAYSINDQGVIVGRLRFHTSGQFPHDCVRAVVWENSYGGYLNYIDLHPHKGESIESKQHSSAYCVNNYNKIVGDINHKGTFWIRSHEFKKTGESWNKSDTYKTQRTFSSTFLKINDREDVLLNNMVCNFDKDFIQTNGSSSVIWLGWINESISKDLGFDKVEKFIDFNNNREVIAEVKMTDGRHHGILIRISE